MATFELNNELSQCKIGLCVNSYTHWKDKTDWRLWGCDCWFKSAICKPFYSQPKWKQLKCLEVAFLSSSKQEAHLGFLSSNPICHTSGEREADQNQHNLGKAQCQEFVQVGESKINRYPILHSMAGCLAGWEITSLPLVYLFVWILFFLLISACCRTIFSPNVLTIEPSYMEQLI